MNIVVQSDLARNPDRISVFGATIPIGDIGFWVIAAVLALQLHFTTQLLELRRLLRTKDLDGNSISEPWIGMFAGVYGRIGAIAATFGLPAGLTVFINVQVLQSLTSAPLVILGCVSIVVGAISCFLIAYPPIKTGG